RFRQFVVAARAGNAGDVLGARDQPVKPDLLHRRPLSAVEGTPVYRSVERTAAFAGCVQSAVSAGGTARVTAHATRRADSRCAAGARRVDLRRYRKSDRANDSGRPARRSRPAERDHPAHRTGGVTGTLTLLTRTGI